MGGMQQGFNSFEFVKFCSEEARRNLVWRKHGEAVKYTRAFESLFGKGKFPWCAAFLHWCLNNYNEGVGLGLPIQIPGSKYTLALCEQWETWGKQEGWYTPFRFDRHQPREPQVGDIILFDWQQDDREDHIGICVERHPQHIVCAEGNSNNRTAIRWRSWNVISGMIRLPEGWVYDVSSYKLKDKR